MENDKRDPFINNWLLLGADGMAYAYHTSGQAKYLYRATRVFRTGSRGPWFEGDPGTSSESKQTNNSIPFGHTFLCRWARR